MNSAAGSLTTTTITDNGQTAALICFGDRSIGAGEWLNGWIADIKIYDAVLTNVEIYDESLQLSPLRTANLNSWFLIDDVQTNQDQSGLGRHLTANGSLAYNSDLPSIPMSGTPVYEQTDFRLYLNSGNGTRRGRLMALRQAAFRFYNNDGAESTSTGLAAQNTSISREDGDESTFLIRFLIQSDAGTAGTNTVPQFQRNLNGGAWGSITTSSNDRSRARNERVRRRGEYNQLAWRLGDVRTTSAGCTHDGTAGGAAFNIVANGRGENRLLGAAGRR